MITWTMLEPWFAALGVVAIIPVSLGIFGIFCEVLDFFWNLPTRLLSLETKLSQLEQPRSD